MKAGNLIRTALSIVVVAMATGVFTTSSTIAALVVEEQFDYAAGNINNKNGGTGFDGAWTATSTYHTFQTGHTSYAQSGPALTLNSDTGLSFAKLDVSGSASSKFGPGGRAQAHRTISAASQTALLGDNTTMWFSALYGQQEYGSPSGGSFAFGLTTGEFTTDRDANDRNLFGWLANPGQGFGFATAIEGPAGGGPGTINAAAWDNSTDPNKTDPIVVQSAYLPSLQVGASHYDTSLIVGKVNWKANGTPDELFLFNVTDLLTEPSEGSAIASITNLDLDQSTFNTLAFMEGNFSLLDEIRLGNSFAEVTPEGDFLTLEVDTNSGAMALLGDDDTSFDINSYQVTSELGQLDPSEGKWNSLDDQNFPATSGIAGDFNNDDLVNSVDLTDPVDGWETRFGADLDGSDFLDWQRNFGSSGTPTGWEEGGAVGTSFLGEIILVGDSTIAASASISLGTVYTGPAEGDLEFVYRTADGALLPGIVTYVGAAAAAAVPEPSSLALVAVGLLGLAFRRRKQA